MHAAATSALCVGVLDRSFRSLTRRLLVFASCRAPEFLSKSCRAICHRRIIAIIFYAITLMRLTCKSCGPIRCLCSYTVKTLSTPAFSGSSSTRGAPVQLYCIVLHPFSVLDQEVTIHRLVLHPIRSLARKALYTMCYSSCCLCFKYNRNAATIIATIRRTRRGSTVSKKRPLPSMTTTTMTESTRTTYY